MKIAARKLQIAAFAAVVVVVLALSRHFGWADMVVSGELFDQVDALLIAHPIEAALLYLGVSLLACVALFVPVAVPAVAGGLIFGAVWGTVLCWVSVVAGSVLGFTISRFFLKSSIKPLLARNSKINSLFFEGVKRRDVYLLALTRLTPILPFNIQNFAYGVTDIAFGPYFVYSSLFLLPGTAICTLGAAGLSGGEGSLACFAIAGVLLLFSVAVAVGLKRSEGRMEGSE